MNHFTLRASLQSMCTAFVFAATLVASGCGGGAGEGAVGAIGAVGAGGAGGGDADPLGTAISVAPAGSNDSAFDTTEYKDPGPVETKVAAAPAPSAPIEQSALSTRAIAAMNSGNPNALTNEDADALLSYARKLGWDLRQTQTQAVSAIYGAQAIDLRLNHRSGGSGGRPIAITKNTVATPLINSDDGTGMVAIAQLGSGRGLAYGADVLDWMAGTSTEQQHRPLFSRAFKWLVVGNAEGVIPANMNFATAAYSAAKVKTVLQGLGATNATAVACAVDNPNNTCWQGLDLIVFGRETANSPSLTQAVRSYLQAGKAVMYVQTGSYPSYRATDGGEAVLDAMGMNSGYDFNGNYFKSAPSVSVCAGMTVANALERADQFRSFLSALPFLGQGSLGAIDFTTSFLTQEVDKIHTALKSLQEGGTNIFTDTDRDIYRALVLWADCQRSKINYGGKLSVKGDAGEFLRTYASDSWLWFNRSATTIPSNGSGDYMPAAAANIPVSSDYENIDVTIPQTGGITLIGRAAIPGKAVSIQIADAAGATSLGVQTSYLRVWGNPLTDATYARPRRPNSFRVPLSLAGETTFVTPFGGPVMLAFGGATANTVIKLRIKGAATYAHFDYTAKPAQAEIDSALAALSRADFGWQTAKFVGGEVQQTIKLAKSAMGTFTPEQYIVGQLKGQLFDSNHFANGYENMPMSQAAQDLCAQLGWTCTGTLHKAPGVQHFVGWIATCGYLCSGNPSDGFGGISSQWGHAHELGHNTVQRVMTIIPHGVGCTTECNNNILASAAMLRQAEMTGIDTGHTLDYKGLYGDIVNNRATGLVAEMLRADMESRLWAKGVDRQDPLRAVHFQLAFQYAKLRLDQAKPTMVSTLEFFQLLTKGDRLVAKAWDASNRGKYGMGRFADNTISNEDLFYVLSSKIIGQDMRKHFAMYGIPVSQTALDSVADLNLPQAARTFYALAPGKHNQLATGQWLPLEGTPPAYPW